MGRERTGHPALVFSIAAVLTLILLLSTNWSGHPKETAAGSSDHPTTSASSSTPPKTASATPSPTHTAAHTATHTATHSATPTLTAAQIRAQAVSQVEKLDGPLAAGSVSIAALNTVTGAHYSYGETAGMWTASVYKLFVLETLLLQKGGPLTGTLADEAIPMIEQSNNVDGYDLFLAAGGRPGLVAAVPRLGLKDTVPGDADPTFTTTSATDMLTLLGNLVHEGPLTAAARSYALGLMRQVEADQRWGVGVDADAGTDFANKNGWLSIDNDNGPGEDDDGLWAVNSVGVLTVDGQQVLMAVMTRHRPDFDSGVSLVEAFARAIKPLVAH